MHSLCAETELPENQNKVKKKLAKLHIPLFTLRTNDITSENDNKLSTKEVNT